jgi:hypothetical protein
MASSVWHASLQFVRDLHLADVGLLLTLHLVDLVVRNGTVQTGIMVGACVRSSVHAARLRVVLGRRVVLAAVQDRRVLGLVSRA